MFRLNIDSVLANAGYAAKAANVANVAKQNADELAKLAGIAKLAISQQPANEPFPVLDELLHAAMLACDHWQDDEDARQQMREDCAGIPPDKRQDWIDHFSRHYRR